MNTSRSSLAIVLRWRPYGESDKIVTFLTQDVGKLTGIAKGAKRSQRRFANTLEPLARVRVYFRQRLGASLAFLESCDLLAPPAGLSEPAKFAYGSYLVELTDQLTVEEHPVAELYALLDEALLALEQGPVTNAFLRGFEVQLLARAGYDPQLDRCSGCQRELVETEPAFLNAAHGTFSCAHCQGPAGSTAEIPVGVLPQLAALRHLSLADSRQQSFGPVAAAAAQLTGRLLALHLARPLRSVKLIAQLTASPA